MGSRGKRVMLSSPGRRDDRLSHHKHCVSTACTLLTADVTVSTVSTVSTVGTVGPSLLSSSASCRSATTISKRLFPERVHGPFTRYLSARERFWAELQPPGHTGGSRAFQPHRSSGCSPEPKPVFPAASKKNNSDANINRELREI